MSRTNARGSFRIVGGAETARLVVETTDAAPAPVGDVLSLAVAEARADGYREGHAAAMAQATREQAELREALARLGEALPQSWEEQLAGLEGAMQATLIDLAFGIAECLLRQPVQSEQVVRGAVAEAMALPLLEGNMDLYCHPHDAAALQQSPPMEARGKLRIVPDARLQPGDACLTTAENGDLEGHLSQRLDVLRDRLRDLALPPSEGPFPA
jgi:flagellar biosynthesis/type III secretory pathway protein FliH